MLIENYHLAGGLSEQQIDVMKEKALDLVEKVGIHVPHEGILNLLSNYDGVTIDKEDVKFKNDLVLKALVVFSDLNLPGQDFLHPLVITFQKKHYRRSIP